MMDPLLFGVDVSALTGRWAAASGGVTLILLGRWLLRAQVIASVVRTLGLFVVLLGVLAVAGVVEVDLATVRDVVRMLLGAFPGAFAAVDAAGGAL